MKQKVKLNGESDVIQLNNRKQIAIILNQLNQKGYRYVVRDKEMPFLTCYSLKPKRYQDVESWGYINPNSQGAMMAYPIKNTDISEINWSNRLATLILDFLAENET